MMKRNVILGLAALALVSCKQFKKGEGDSEYLLHKDKEGPTIQEGDFVALHTIQKTEEDSVLTNSYDFDRPIFVTQQKSVFKGDIYQSLGMLSEGDSATFKINMDSLSQKMNMPKPENTKGKYMLFTFKVDKVIPKGKLSDSVFNQNIESYFKAEVEAAKGKEEGKMKKYLSSNNLKPTVSPSGLNYVVTKQGNGAKPAAGDTVQLNYTLKLLSGKVVESTKPDVAKKAGTFNAMRPYEPMKMPVGVNAAIPGFDEGLLMFPKGTSATLIIPSKLAYGEQGNQIIGPYTPLIFDIEVLDIIKGKPGSTPAPMPPMHPEHH